MATLHNIGELLRSGVRPTDEETEHLRELGGFVAEMYGRFMGGHAEHLASPSDLWSGRLSKRLSATTGARWEHGIGLAEMLLGSELTSFWQVASQGFSEGYGDFGGEMPMLALYEDEAPAAIEAAVDAAPARRRPSLFGSRQPAGARGRLNPAKLAKLAGRSGDGAVPGASPKAADGARWRDGSLAEMTVIKALSEGGLYLGDQLSAPVASLEFARRREAASVQRSGSVRPDASDVARAAGGAAAQRSNERGVVLDGVRIDGRTPALAAALSRADAVFGRGASAASERAAISESRMASLTASPSVSLDRGLGMGERPVYGFYDAVETSFLRLQDESTPAVAASVGGVVAPKGRRAGRVVQSSMPPSAAGRARALEARSTAPGFPGAPSATERQAQVARRATGAASQAPAMSLDHVVANAAGLRPFVGGVFSSPEASLGTSERLLATAGPRAHGVLFASDVAHDRAGQAIPKVQRGSMFAPRSMLVEGHVASRNALGGAGGAGASTDAFLERVAQVRSSQSGVDAYVGASTLASSDGAAGARDGRPGQVAAAAGQMGVWASPPSNGSGPVPDGVTTRGAFGGAGAAPLGFAADSSFAMAGVGASAASWRLAVDGGPDLPLGATFSRHEAFAGERLNPEAQVSGGGAAAFRSIVAGGESRPSELAQSLDGMVWVTLPQDGGGAPTVGEGLPLAALPRGRRAAMVPASLAFRAMKGSSQRAGEIAALRSGGSVAGPESVPAARTVGAQAVPGMVGATAAAGAQASAFASRTSAFEGRVLAALRSGRLESIAAADGAEHATSSRFLSSLVRDAAASVSAVSSPVLAADAVRGTSVGALALAGDRRMTTGGGAIGGVERAAMVEQQQSMRAARFLERAVAQDGYGRIESERELIRQIAERELGSSDVATASTGGAASRRAVRSASSARGGDAVRGADAARGADSVSVASSGLSRLTEAKAALLRPVPTAREARAIADAFGPSGFVAAQAKSSSALSFERAGSDEPVLARLLASRGAQRGEVTVGERWELGGAFGERIASLSPERQREVARTFRAAGWGEQELEMLRIERSPGIDAAQPSAGADALGGRRSAAARRAQAGTGQATVAGGLTQAAVATGSNFEQLGGPAAFVDAPSREGGKLAARIERLGRNMSRVALGAEALSGSVVEREAGVASMSAAKGVASTWLPLLGASGGATASYFGGLAPGVRAGSSGGGFASMREAIGDLVAIAEAGASNSDSPVGLSARREVLRRAIVAAERGFGGTVEARLGSGREPSTMAVARRGDEMSMSERAGVAQTTATSGREIGTQALAESRLDSPVGRRSLEAVLSARVEGLESMGVLGAGARDLAVGDADRTMVGLGRDSVVAGLEGRLAEALALSASGPAGARRLLRGKVRDLAPSEDASGRRRGREPSEAELVKQTVREGARPERVSAVDGEAAIAASGARRMGLGERASLTRNVETGRTAALATGFGVAAGEGPGVGYSQIGGTGDLVRSSEGAHVAALAEERGRHLPVSLGKVMAPEAMLQGLRSRELTQAMSSVSTRQAQYGHQMVPVLTTLADAGVDLGAARSSIALRSQLQGRAAVRGLGARDAGESFGAGRGELATSQGVGQSGIGLFGGESSGVSSALAGRAPEQSLVQMLAESGGLEGGVAAAVLGGRGIGRRQRAGMLSSILRGTERAEMAALLEQAGGREFAFAWLNRVDGSRSGLDLGMGSTRQEFGKAFGARRESLVSGDSPISGASLVQTAPARSEDRSGLRSVASSMVSTSTGAARPQHGASAAMRRTDWSFVDTGSRASTTHADLGKLASAIVGSADTSVRAPMPLVAPAAKAVAQTALRDSKTSSAAASPNQGGKPAAPARGPVDAKMSEKAVEMLAIEMANRVARLMGLMKERIGVWS